MVHYAASGKVHLGGRQEEPGQVQGDGRLQVRTGWVGGSTGGDQVPDWRGLAQARQGEREGTRWRHLKHAIKNRKKFHTTSQGYSTAHSSERGSLPHWPEREDVCLTDTSHSLAARGSLRCLGPGRTGANGDSPQNTAREGTRSRARRHSPTESLAPEPAGCRLPA